MRQQWIDALKGILILLVILGHAIQYSPGIEAESNHFWNMIYSFHMPAFMTISGYLIYRTGGGIRNRSTMIGHRFSQLFIPFIVWSMISSLLVPSKILHQFANCIIYPDSSYWFLWALFWISLIFISTDYISEKFRIKLELGEIVVAIVLVCIMVFAEFRYFGFQFISYYFLFYIAGYFYRKYENLFPKNRWLVTTLFALWVILAWFSNAHQLPVFLRSFPLVPDSILLYSYRFITAVIACYVLMIYSPRLLDVDTTFNKILSYLGKYSLGIYVFHLFLFRILTHLGGNIKIDSTVSIIITFAIAATMSCGVVHLLSLNKFTARYLLGKL